MTTKLIILTTLLFSFAAQAASNVCAGPTLYYSFLRADLGMRPPPGMVIGSITIVSNSKILVKEDIIAGLGKYKVSPYSVELSEDGEVIDRTGNRQEGSSISKKTAILYKINAVNPADKKEINREEVVCKNNWKMAI